ncbi:zinc finger CCCH domain-containing protein 33-like isoform X1 [Iris pallida]|uniref:Zinc finger CCCH domain-containing protein 33-like isoform X1 n=1 Tax=Iris pallida TaxID=29817 RepID=A0AAX6IBV7_IRIPA|nr:zinc finger CCCH domain-containing protein 33-like isoform X1 [Iris pallida]
MRRGVCGYGSNCQYNHPAYNGQVYLDRGELPERVGQPNCQYFLKTGTCKFGATCKYHHPRDGHDIRPVALNVMGLPLRQDEKSCPYYMRYGTCKFGIACKFNHPQPAALCAALPATGAPTYGSSGSSTVPSSSVPLIGGLSTWPLARSPYLSSPHMQSLPAYMLLFFHLLKEPCLSSKVGAPTWATWTTFHLVMSLYQIRHPAPSLMLNLVRAPQPVSLRGPTNLNANITENW